MTILYVMLIITIIMLFILSLFIGTYTKTIPSMSKSIIELINNKYLMIAMIISIIMIIIIFIKNNKNCSDDDNRENMENIERPWANDNERHYRNVDKKISEIIEKKLQKNDMIEEKIDPEPFDDRPDLAQCQKRYQCEPCKCN